MEFKHFPRLTHPERLWTLSKITDEDKIILDLGCGRFKTLERAIGMDNVSHVDIFGSIDSLPQESGKVDVIISRHSFEHMLDQVKTLNEWLRVLRVGGRIIFVLPDQEFINTIDPFYSNNEHMHAYTRQTMAHFLSLFPVELLVSETVIPEWSFGIVVQKL